MTQELKSLKKIFDHNQCDKGPLKHHYNNVYDKYFIPFVNSNPKRLISILEVGVYNGNSIRCWIDYFSLENIERIVGIDIFERVPREEVYARFSEQEREKIQLIQADSTEHVDLGEAQFDYIIDDGCHTPETNEKTFRNLIPYLKNQTGIYFIEDVWPLDVMNDKELNHRWIKYNHPKLYTQSKFKSFMNSLDGYYVVRHDQRKVSGQPDSYIFAISKND